MTEIYEKIHYIAPPIMSSLFEIGEDTHNTSFTQFITRMAARLLLTFFIYLHNQLSSIHSITRIKSTEV